MRKHLSESTGPQRLIYGLVAGVCVALLPVPTDWPFRALLGWCVGAAVYLVLAWWLAEVFDSKGTRERAQAQDEPSVVIFGVMVLAVLASVASITLMLQQVKEMGGTERLLHMALAMLALALSWLFIHTIYAFHYAHRYYHEEKRKEPDGPGLVFPNQPDPDYFDFLYYSFVIGMTSQVSDVQVSSREMRRLTLGHGILSFTFNVLIVALTINVVAGSV
ncbi:DUF1345 domain-containing protein [Polaromonas eurypsychrophila]|uniref:DUF1345 domain-containing protein n=1 Tax=Polaromonas eurypsychrophila TaxID=1614635 RepID=A0A916SFH9_9BURK|nr:DUF1345 domain-containing protein [Polaromonas eurypsychrophila]GGA97705.1 hypothetical protein GCM10011496_18470 [Polaromonas eurypsychrophila]